MSDQTTTLPKRSEIPEALKWDIDALYPDLATFEADFRTASRLISEYGRFKGKLAESGEMLLAALTHDTSVEKLLEKLNAYTGMRISQDTKDTDAIALSDRVTALYSQAAAASSFLRPELLAIDEATLKHWVETVPGLALHALGFERVRRALPHIRSAEVMEVLGASSKALGAPVNVYGALQSSLPFPTILNAEGKPEKVVNDNLNSRWLSSFDKGERKRGFRAVMGTCDQFRDVFAAIYSARVDGNIFNARQQKYSSCLEWKLEPQNIPTSVYTALIDAVHANLPALQRYLELKKRLLKLKELHLYDLYVPVIGESKAKFDWDAAKKMAIAALAPMGDEYVAKFAAGYEQRWYDVMQTENKRGGAWGGGGCYSSYPYSMLNHHGDLESVFTAIHEGGHCMHSLLSRESQPFEYWQYVIFVAEVASTLNEALLEHHLLTTAPDKAVKLSVLNKCLEAYRATLFRQVLFAEFELAAHQLAEKGKPLTADVLSRLYRRLYRQYYGGACVVDKLIGAEWMRIPHLFESPFYVYQYAVGMSCARDLARQLLTEGEPARNRIINNFLRAGCSKDPIDILRDAGTDPSTSHPVDSAMKDFSERLAEFEGLLTE